MTPELERQLKKFIWRIQKDHFFEGGDGGGKDDKDYRDLRTEELIELLQSYGIIEEKDGGTSKS